MFAKQCVTILLLALLVKESQSLIKKSFTRRRKPSPPPCRFANCQVSGWSRWSSCSHRCGNTGTRSRTRYKTITEKCGGSCSYQLTETQSCNRDACQNGGTPKSGRCNCRYGFTGTCCEFSICVAKNCQVSGWSEWSSCSHGCGNAGTRYRTRSKTVIESCGVSCSYNLNDTQSCNRDACQNGGTPTSGRCYCRYGFTGTCCEFADSNDDPKLYFYYDSPLYPTVYKVIKGSLTGVQKAFDDPNHNTIAKNDQFTVIVNVSSPIYNAQRQWYEMPAVFCFYHSIKDCVNKKRPFRRPYLVMPLSLEIPVPFMIPFKKLRNITSPDCKTVYAAGTVHDLFKTFEVNGAKYNTSTGLLVSFSAKSSAKAGQISGIEFNRSSRRVLKHQPLIQCYFVEWSTDGCVPGLNHMMFGYDIKFMKKNSRQWLKPVDFPGKKDDKYLQKLHIPGIGQKNYLVFKEMTLDEVSLIHAHPFSYLFESVEELVKATLKLLGVNYVKGRFLGSGKYESYSKHYSKQSYAAAMSGVELRFFSGTMSSSYLKDDTNWDDGFKNKWKKLFDQSKKENVMEFFKEYGTHYVVEAVMGGRQEALFTVDYCEISKEPARKAAFKAKLKKPYQLVPNNVSVEIYYNDMVKQSPSKIFRSSPQTHCFGGNSFDPNICYNITLWRKTVLSNPCPIRMTLKPFYTFVKDYEDRLWMEKMYQEYLKADLDEVKINYDIQLRVKCKQGTSTNENTNHLAYIVLCLIPIVIITVLVYKIINRSPNSSTQRKSDEQQDNENQVPLRNNEWMDG